MARRRTSLVEDIFDLLLQLPWWAGVISAVLFWFFGQVFMSQPATDPIRPLINLMFNGLALISLLAAVVSTLKSLSRIMLLDRQSGIDSLRSLSWREFEHLVGEAYRRQGYIVEETGGGGADGGIDLILRGHGGTVLVQCKQWRARQVGVNKVRELFGVVTAEHADRGILVTSGKFTKDAQSFKIGKPLTLVDGPALAQIVRSVQRGSKTTETVSVNASSLIEPSCPRCASPMITRTARRGANAGSQFYGCTRYPQCRGTRPAD